MKCNDVFVHNHSLRMAYFLPHLHTAYAVDRAIQDETEKLVVIRFGHDTDRQCMLVGLSGSESVY